MNCQGCDARIDYRFITSCTYCDCEVKQPSLVETAPSSALDSHESVEKPVTWRRGLINVVYILVSSLAGMISGAVIVYFAAAFTYLAFFSRAGAESSHDCARGMAIAFLSIMLGAFLGTVGGSVFAVKHPLCRGVGK